MENNTILIDRYLQNEMSGEERIAFERQLAGDKNLQEELRVQKMVVTAANDTGVKAEFTKAFRKKVVLQRTIQWSIIGAVVVGALIFLAIKSGIFSKKHEGHTTEATRVVSNEPAGRFNFNNSSDTIIETRDGVIFAIPKGAFNTDGPVDLEIRTAITPYDIMANGLSTYSNGALLQTAGMFYFNAYRDGKPLELVKDISVSVPTEQVNPKMQLFDGVEDNNGRVNWANPKPIEKRLRTYDITTLDFYPPNYKPVLKTLNKPYANKRYTDSLYYSFAGHPHQPKVAENVTAPVAPTITKNEIPLPAPINNVQQGQQDSIVQRDSLVQRDTTGPAPDISGNKKDTIDKLPEYDHDPYEIDPARIRAIWDRKFNNTLLGTKEFEERLRFMHSICNGHRYLAIYLQNLDKPMYVSDEQCARLSRELSDADDEYNKVRRQFLAFAARKEGSVLIEKGLQQKLSEYIRQRYTAYQEAARKTWEKDGKELQRLKKEAETRRTEKAETEYNRKQQIFDEEFCINLTDAYRQIGIERKCKDTIGNPVPPPPPPPVIFYNVTVTTTGWKNLDAYVMDATTTRESTSYTDPETGRTATITYKEFSVQVLEQSSYDRVLVYLIPDSLSTYQRLEQAGTVFKEKLNMLFRYDLVVLGYRGEQVFYYRQQTIQAGSVSVQLSPGTPDKLRSVLSSYNQSKAKEWEKEFEYQLAEQKELLREIQVRKDLEFRSIIESAIYSCQRESSEWDYYNDEQPAAKPETTAVLRGK